jgi:hypothetical protein
MAFGVRNFTVSGTTNDPVFKEIPKSTYSLIYPALNANSIWIPPYTEVESFQNGVFQYSNTTSDLYECVRF